MARQKPESGSTLLANPFKPAYLGPAYWGTWVLIGLLFILHLLPASWTDALAKPLGDLARNANAKRRRIARINLKLCYPDLDETTHRTILRAHFRAQIRSVLHYGMVWWGSQRYLRKRIIVKGQEHIESSLARGRNVIIMAAHCVGLDVVGASILMRYPVTGPMKVMRNDLINYFVARGRTRYGTRVYSREAGLRPIIKDVRAGHVLLYLSDEDLGPDRSIFTSFFGQTKATIPVLGRMARSCDADVLPMMGCYDQEKHQYTCNILPPIRNFPQGDDLADATRMNEAIEQLVNICPAEYFWTFKFFRTRPPGEPDIY